MVDYRDLPEIDINKIATDLNGKADTDLTNVTNTGTSRGASWAMPSDKYIDLTPGTSGARYTAPANGYYYIGTYSTYANQGVFAINDYNLMTTGMISCNANQPLRAWIPVMKGQTVTLAYEGNVSDFRFIYAQGSESEAS